MDRVYLIGKSRAATTNFRFLNMSSVISYLWPQTYGNAFFAETWRPYSTLSQAILFQSWDPRLPLFFFLLQLIHEDALRCRSRNVRAWQTWNEMEVDKTCYSWFRTRDQALRSSWLHRSTEAATEKIHLPGNGFTRNVSFIWDKLKTPLKDININLDTRKDVLSHR